MSLPLENPLHHAIQLLLSPVEERFQRFLDVCDDVHATDAAGNTLLHWAAALGNFSAARALLLRGVDVDARNGCGATPLLVAAALCTNVASMGYLLVSCGASLTTSVGMEEKELTVRSVLESRQLAEVWPWLLTYHRSLRHSDKGSCCRADRRGQRDLPALAASPSAALLGSPQRLKQLLGDSSNGSLECPPGTQPSTALTTNAACSTARQPADEAALVAQHSSTALAADEVFSLARQPTPQTVYLHEHMMHIELLQTREAVSRLQVERDQVESFLQLYAETMYVSYTFADAEEDEVVGTEHAGWWASGSGGVSGGAGQRDLGEGGGDGVSPSVQAVLGERIDGNGRRFLLVRYDTGEGDDDADGVEEWRWAESLRADAVVRAHLERTYSATPSGEVSGIHSPSAMSLRNVGSPLETWERDQLEAQLRLLPRRALLSRESESSRLVPSTSAFFASPTELSPNLENAPPLPDLARRLEGEEEVYAALYDLKAEVPEIKRASWRFATAPVSQFDTTEELSAAEDLASQQLLLSAGRSKQVEVEESPRPVSGAAVSAVPPPSPSAAGEAKRSSQTAPSMTPPISPGQSSAPPRAPTMQRERSMMPSLPTASTATTVLTASQKSEYNNFLYSAALRLIGQKQKVANISKQ